MSASRYGASGRPYTRWWWFADQIQESDIDRQLDWVRENGFGGVEIAFVYPYEQTDTVDPFLGERFRHVVAHAAEGCSVRDLGFDVTFGTLWPFGGSMVSQADASRTWDGLSEQRLRRSWESGEGREPGYILNHLDASALSRYDAVVGHALQPAVDRITASGDSPIPVCFFLDSWEVHPEKLWADGFGDAFEARFGYQLEPWFETIDSQPAALHDYRKLLAEYALEQFYAPYTRICNERGALARVQCHGAPTDLIAAYAYADVPESEAILFDAGFSQIAASAAAQSGARVVSAEAFTCLYGWQRWPGPGQHQGNEKWEDIRLLGDALLANGVNLLVWHGMPFQRADRAQRFYASVHVGPDASFAPELPKLNEYFTWLSSRMQQGRTYSRLAVYLPLEDSLRQGELPEEQKRPSAQYHWEMHYQQFPRETVGYRPVWTSTAMLRNARVRDDGIHLGELVVPALYVDAAYLDRDSLSAMLDLCRSGAQIVLKSHPQYPGLQEPADYQSSVRELASKSLHTLSEVRDPARANTGALEPVLTMDEYPEFWVRCVKDADGEQMYRFWFTHPASRGIHYPMEYAYSSNANRCTRNAVLHLAGKRIEAELDFRANSGILLEADSKGIRHIVHGDDLFG